ncbi:transglutaminase-like domain-containing protein [Mesobacillus foraminis]|uniref:Transglutaminase superfamily protein n=1 Tax=Mesobacillus foraminis TaxID=279826 RepID=A0A4R2BGR4_9BACI|nr:transglutaminase family protein [Mesobacillus foraminis]TCN26181.1 transglutaminase superfamily protein [Mesobacillus foraminis]
MICESERLDDYLLELEEVNYSNPVIKARTEELFHPGQDELEKVKTAFVFVRDKIAHSWDIQGRTVTCNASDVLLHKEGICYAKSHLLAALLRSQGIPAGFCYQRLMLFDTPEQGYCIHALNAVYINTLDKWVRLDARGNKKGIHAEFSIGEERLAFPVDEKIGEIDYPMVYTKPHPKTVSALIKHRDILDIYKHYLPESL